MMSKPRVRMGLTLGDTDNTFDFITEFPAGTYTVTASQATSSQSAPTISCGVSPSGSQTANADMTVNVICGGPGGPGGPPGGP